MARTFTCNEEIIVVSKGTEDIGKLAMLGNGGKFDPSVIPEMTIGDKKVPTCIAYSNTSQSSINGVTTKLKFNNVVIDTDNIADNASDTSKTSFIIRTKGIYDLRVQTMFSTRCNQGIGFSLNGSEYVGSVNQQGLHLSTSAMIPLNVGDYLEVNWLQESGDTVSTVYQDNPRKCSRVAIMKVADY